MGRECEVYLEPIEHVYIHKTSGEKFKSVTTVLSMLEPHFPAEEVAFRISQQSEEKRKPEYRGMNQEQILAEWKRINDEANIYGTRIHEILERYLLADRIYIPQNGYEREIITKFQKVDKMGGTLYPETVLFSKKYGIAGMCDLIEDCGEYFNVWDNKTNKKINFMSEYGHWLNKPVSHLSDCQYNVYCLQMSIYAYLYQMETKKKVGRLALYYLNPEKDFEFEVIPCPYLGREAKDVLDHWLETQKK